MCLENRLRAISREFESHTLRQIKKTPKGVFLQFLSNSMQKAIQMPFRQKNQKKFKKISSKLYTK